jgi:hypothetical protein
METSPSNGLNTPVGSVKSHFDATATGFRAMLVQPDEGAKHVCLRLGSAVLGLQLGAFGVKSERKSATPSR